MARVGGGICPGWVNVESACAADLAMTGIFGRSRVPKIAQGLSMFIYYALEAERGIPVDGPVLPSMAPCFVDGPVLPGGNPDVTQDEYGLDG